MRKLLLWLSFTTVLSPAFPVNAAPLVNPCPITRSSTVQFQDGRLSVILDAVPIREALVQVADQSGITILFDKNIEQNVTVRFDLLPMKAALRRLLRQQGHSFYYASAPGGGFQISKIRVFRRGKPALADYEVIKGGMDTDVNCENSDGKIGQSGAARVGGTEDIGGPTHSEGYINRKRIMDGLGGAYVELNHLHRKMKGEKRVIRHKMAELQWELVNGQCDARDILEQSRLSKSAGDVIYPRL